MLKEDYINKKAKTIHYAYIYYKDGTPFCFVVDNDSVYKLANYNKSTDKIIKNIKNDIGVYTNNYRKFKNFCKEYKEGEFSFTFKELTSLKNSPKVITGNFDCTGNKLTSLKGGPEEVNGNFNCSYNNITSLKNSPKVITGNFDCRSNKLISLKGAIEKVNGSFNCAGNKLTSLKGGPKVVKGNFDCSDNQLTSLEGCPKIVEGNFICLNNDITKEELIRYLETADISGEIYTSFGRFMSKDRAIERLSGQITYFDY